MHRVKPGTRKGPTAQHRHPVPLHVGEPPCQQATARRAWRRGWTMCSGTGGGWGWMGPCGCQALRRREVCHLVPLHVGDPLRQQATARRAWRRGWTICSGTGCGWGWMGPCGCQALRRREACHPVPLHVGDPPCLTYTSSGEDEASLCKIQRAASLLCVLYDSSRVTFHKEQSN